MNNSDNKNIIIVVMMVIVGLLAAWLIYYNGQNADNLDSNPNIDTESEESPTTPNPNPNDPDTGELMSLVIYIQDTTAAQTNDCGITRPQTIQVPQTTAVANASLEYLFNYELSDYAEYESVVINNGVASVNLASDNTPSGSPLSSLSSCQTQHLLGVLEDTLEQYDSIQSVELYSPSGQVQF